MQASTIHIHESIQFYLSTIVLNFIDVESDNFSCSMKNSQIHIDSYSDRMHDKVVPLVIKIK